MRSLHQPRRALAALLTLWTLAACGEATLAPELVAAVRVSPEEVQHHYQLESSKVEIEYVPFSTAPMTVSRDAADPGPAPEPDPEPAPSATATAAPPATPAPAPAAPSGTSGGGDPEKLFEDLYDRLKRELLLEQEQLGQAFREP